MFMHANSLESARTIQIIASFLSFLPSSFWKLLYKSWDYHIWWLWKDMALSYKMGYKKFRSNCRSLGKNDDKNFKSWARLKRTFTPKLPCSTPDSLSRIFSHTLQFVLQNSQVAFVKYDIVCMTLHMPARFLRQIKADMPCSRLLLPGTAFL